MSLNKESLERADLDNLLSASISLAETKDDATRSGRQVIVTREYQTGVTDDLGKIIDTYQDSTCKILLDDEDKLELKAFLEKVVAKNLKTIEDAEEDSSE
jgi:hypothetical protein